MNTQYTVKESKCDWDSRLDGYEVMRPDGVRHSKYWTELEAQNKANFLNKLLAARG